MQDCNSATFNTLQILGMNWLGLLQLAMEIRRSQRVRQREVYATVVADNLSPLFNNQWQTVKSEFRVSDRRNCDPKSCNKMLFFMHGNLWADKWHSVMYVNCVHLALNFSWWICQTPQKCPFPLERAPWSQSSQHGKPFHVSPCGLCNATSPAWWPRYHSTQGPNTSLIIDWHTHSDDYLCSVRVNNKRIGE